MPRNNQYRLTRFEVDSLGLKWKGKDGKRNPRYRLKKELINKLYEIRGTNKGAKVLIFDIETAPLAAYVWSLWKNNVGGSQIISNWFMLTWSAKWLFDDKVMADKLTSKEALKQNDKRIVKSLFKLIDEADIVIAHNGDKFDLRKVNTRFLLHGLGTPSSFQSIDTLKHARKQLAFSSNRLDYLGNMLGVGRKIDTGGFDLWARCMAGEDEAFQEMEDYNIQDVLLLEEVYLLMRPYIKPHPNLGLYIGDGVTRCPSCGSDKLEPTGEYYTTVNAYTELKCKCCGSNSRSRQSSMSLSKRRHVLSSLPR